MIIAPLIGKSNLLINLRLSEMTMNNCYTTSDLSLAAYLSMKGLALKKATKVANGRFEFTLEDPNDIGESLSLEYINSDFSKFDNQIRLVKKLLYTK